jgi:hypothetical protein
MALGGLIRLDGGLDEILPRSKINVGRLRCSALANALKVMAVSTGA